MANKLFILAASAMAALRNHSTKEDQRYLSRQEHQGGSGRYLRVRDIAQVSSNKFTPHQGERECARRIRQMAHITDKKVVVAINHMTFA